MQATLVYNPNAGNTARLTPEKMQEALQKAGFHPVYDATECEADLDDILKNVEGLVVSVGGDGTLRAVLTRLVGQDNVVVAPVPMGTANNLGQVLGIQCSPLELIEQLRNPIERSLDIGHVVAPWGEDYFVEGAGMGFFAHVLARYNPEKGKSVLRSLQSIVQSINEGFSYKGSLMVDGQAVGGNFLLVEVLNTPAVGPRLRFAPDALPGDGFLNVVCIEESDREGVVRYVSSMLAEDLDKLSTVTEIEGREVLLSWHGEPFHVDGEVRPYPIDEVKAAENVREAPEFGSVKIRIIPQAVKLWLPSSAAPAGAE